MKSNLVLLALILASCQPEMPVTSSILVKGDGLTVPVNKELYGLTIEEINHAVDGGIYAELIQNRSFEDGVPPLNCPYDPVRRVLTTPNGLFLSCVLIRYRDGVAFLRRLICIPILRN